MDSHVPAQWDHPALGLPHGDVARPVSLFSSAMMAAVGGECSEVLTTAVMVDSPLFHAERRVCSSCIRFSRIDRTTHTLYVPI